MNKATVIITAILTVIFLLGFSFLLYLGGGFVYYYTDSLIDIVYEVLFFSMGLTITLTVIPVLICDIVQYRKKKKKKDLFLSLGLALVGVIMVCYAIVDLLIYWGVSITLYEIADALGIPSDAEEKVGVFMRIVRWFIAAPAVLYLIIAPMVRMIFTKERALQYRAFLYQPALGVILLMLTLMGSVVVWLQRPTGTIIKGLGFALAAFAVVYLIASLAGLSKAVRRAKEREAREAVKPQPEPEQKPVHKQPLDLPFNVPTGVEPDDL